MQTQKPLSSGTRKYTPIWREIKEKGECSIRCPVSDVYTIIRAVQKEKNRDKNRPKMKVLEHDISGSGEKTQIKFRLVTQITINDL